MAISKVVLNGTTLMDATTATAAAEDITAPKTAMLADGVMTEGTGSSGGSGIEDCFVTKTLSGTYDNARVGTIGEYAFTYCSSLTAANFPICTSISSWAFNRCTSLSAISFPKCESIGSNAFYYCTSLTSADFPECTGIGSYAFAMCSSLSTISFPKCTFIGDGAFSVCTNLISADFSLITSIAPRAFCSCVHLSSISFPKCSVIGSAAFSMCQELSSVSFSKCRRIDSYAFASTGITALNFSNFPICTVVYSYAFSGCSNLSIISLPALGDIGPYTFRNCYSLHTICLCTASYINYSAFQNCSRLLSLYLLSSRCCAIGATTAFSSTPISTYTAYTDGAYGNIYVRESLYETYISSTVWTSFSSRFISMANSEIISQFPYSVSASGEVSVDGAVYFPFDGVPIEGQTYHLYVKWKHQVSQGYREYLYDGDIVWADDGKNVITAESSDSLKITVTIYVNYFYPSFSNIDGTDLYEITISLAT